MDNLIFDFKSSVGDGLKVYEDRIVISHSGVLNFFSMGIKGDKTIYYNDNTSTISTIDGAFHSVGAFSTGVSTTGDNELIYSGSTTIPCFNKKSDADNYVKSGDTSNQILFLNTKWNLYIDGSQNPL